MITVNANSEQLSRAQRLYAEVLELLNNDTSMYERSDHIDHARELLRLRDQSVSLAYEVALAQNIPSDELKVEFMGETMRSSIDFHLRIAEAMR